MKSKPKFKVGDRVQYYYVYPYPSNPTVYVGTIMDINTRTKRPRYGVRWDGRQMITNYDEASLIRIINGLDRVLNEI